METPSRTMATGFAPTRPPATSSFAIPPRATPQPTTSPPPTPSGRSWQRLTPSRAPTRGRTSRSNHGGANIKIRAAPLTGRERMIARVPEPGNAYENKSTDHARVARPGNWSAGRHDHQRGQQVRLWREHWLDQLAGGRRQRRGHRRLRLLWQNLLGQRRL